MSRDDSSLYTGMTSNASKLARLERAKSKEAKEVKRGALLPAYELVNREIKKTQDEIADELRRAVTLDITTEQLKALVLGLRTADSRMDALRIRLNNIMRLNKGDVDPDIKEMDS